MWDGTWFGAWDGVWFGTTEVGGGGGGTGGGAGGGPGTYPLPPGLTSQQKKAYAALVACAPCCESGSGSGSGGGSGRARIPCCDPTPTITTVSWSMTGAVCGCDGTEPTIDGECNVPLEFSYPPEALSSTGSAGILGVTCGDLVVTMSLCCIETATDGTFYRFGAGISYTDGGGFTQAIFISDFFDVASCALSYFEVNNLDPVSVEVIGTPGCNLSGLKLSAVFS